MKEARHILSEILRERAVSLPGYSLRAFARDLSVSPQQLSNVINGERGLSPALAEKVVNTLGLDDYQREIFRESLRARFSRSKSERALAKGKLLALQTESHTRSLELDLFRVVSNWHHFALVELIKLSSTRRNPVAWFSQKLSLSENEVQAALGRLERVGLVSKQGSRWKVNQDVILADKGISSDAIRNYHRQLLEKAIQATAFQSLDERYGSSSMIPVNVKSLERAKKLIQEFRLAFANEVADSKTGQEVYGLSVHFFKLTESIQENHHES